MINPSAPHSTVLIELEKFLGKKLKYPDEKSSCIAVANYFRKLNPKTETQYKSFYDSCNDYIFENAYYSNRCKQRIHKIIKCLNLYKIKNVLEIGPGTGSDSIALIRSGFNVSVLHSEDFAFKFFIWRLKRRKLTCKIKRKIEFTECILSFDTIEHVYNPFDFVKILCKNSKFILITQSFGNHDPQRGGFPQHMPYKFNKVQEEIFKQGFKKIKLNIAFPPHFYKKVES